MIGEHSDGSTVVATDLAGGWIPPHIDIPLGVDLLPPRPHRAGLATMLGAPLRSAIHRPGEPLSPAAAAAGVSMTIRARDTAAVPDLGWELSQATKWRDGLPRLAHTLAKACAAATGCVDSEVTLLGEHLAALRTRVLAGYPDAVEPADLANWQLLATIAAMAEGASTSANYHFAWFQVQTARRQAVLR